MYTFRITARAILFGAVVLYMPFATCAVEQNVNLNFNSEQQDLRPFEKKIEQFKTEQLEFLNLSRTTYELIDKALGDIAQQTVAKKLNKRLSIHLERLPKSVSESVDNQDPCDQIAGCLVLVQTSERILKMLTVALVAIDDHLKQHITYWEQQSRHEWNYFLHKSPTKWFMGKKQYQEIKDNIVYLKDIRKMYLTILGKLNNVRNSFDVQGSVHECYGWVYEVIESSQELIADDCMSTIFNQEYSGFNGIMACLQKILVNFNQHKDQFNLVINKDAHLPNYFIRNWLKISLASIALGYAGKYLINNPEVIADVHGKVESGFNSFVGNNILYPFKAFDQALFGPVPVYDWWSVGPIKNIQKLIEAQRVTLAILASMPAALAGYGLMRGIKKVFQFNYKPILEDVLDLETFLNSHINVSNGALNDEDHGRLICMTRHLSQKISGVNFAQKEQDYLRGRMCELESPISVEQKIKTLNLLNDKLKLIMH